MDFKFSKDDIAVALIYYLAIKGYKVNGEMMTRISPFKGIESITISDVVKHTYNTDRLIEKIKNS